MDESTTLAPAFKMLPTSTPTATMDAAMNAAKIILTSAKKNGWLIRIKGRPYFCYEAWAALGAPYGITAATTQTEFLSDMKPISSIIGVRAIAEARHYSGVVLGRAEQVCMLTEKPLLHQCMGMAQTRACSRALAQVLRWIPALVEVEGTPAEEMREHEDKSGQTGEAPQAARRPGIAAPHAPAVENIPSDAELRVMCRGAAIAVGGYPGPNHGSLWLKDTFNVSKIEELTATQKIEAYRIAKVIVDDARKSATS